MKKITPFILDDRGETEPIISNDIQDIETSSNSTDSEDGNENSNITSKADIDIILMITTPSC